MPYNDDVGDFMENQFESLINNIKQYTTSAIFAVVHNPTLDTDLLYVYTRGASRKILVFDKTKDIKPIAKVLYNIGKYAINLSSIEVEEDYQRNGIGSSLMQLMLAHGDSLGATELHGMAKPINNIKGITIVGKDCMQEELCAIKQFYCANGCTFDEETDIYADEYDFSQSWQGGEKVKDLDDNLLEFACQILSKEQTLTHKPKTL